MYYQLICKDDSINQMEYISHQNQLNYCDSDGYPVPVDNKREASYYLEEEGVTEFLPLFVVLPIGFNITFQNGQFFIDPQFEENKEWGFWRNQIYPLQNNKWMDYKVIHSEVSHSKALEMKGLLESIYQMGKEAAALAAINLIDSMLLGN